MAASRPTVLLVDDDPDLLKLVGTRLTSAGYEVVAVESAEAALARLSVQRPQVVVTDLRLQGLDGMALFQSIRASDPALPVIVLTAHGTIPDAVEATASGVFAYLTKPYDPAVLLAKVAQAITLSGGTDPAAESGWCRDIVTRSAAMQTVLSEAKMVAAGDAAVLIQGESGTGKELLARAIHQASPRREGPFVAINCGAIPEQLLESELFGHVKGAFTGAHRPHTGLIQTAHGGTLFLDEIGDMPTLLQVKLLRVLQDREVRPVGAIQATRVDVRFISATHRDLRQAVEEGRFREDLYYRLAVVTLKLPALAERREDIPLLANHYLGILARKYRKEITGFSAEALEALMAAPWPGNVRQLANVVEQCCALTTTPVIPASLVTRALRENPTEVLSYAEAKARFERDYLIQLLKLTRGNVAEAARLAQRNRTEFYRLLRRANLQPGMFKYDHLPDVASGEEAES
ncbi:sigma 54-interacting transcriptional regulator [Pelomicrobium methylotrophicum]|uniref:Response regulator n=1 Tax=Pelomicrobium methylotrophicum TaxID=2602750 RepID=A0A5C7EZ22_9PROT|nr:sigma 54-interacting transcriptional regulator [Pelomicrobium methylotrophicum]TXF12368.1 response regulator [Pelomicrobium methylotrophicum]